MKKIKPLILVLITTLSFLFGVAEIKALPTCDFDNYGTLELRTQKEVNDGDWTKYGIGFYQTSNDTEIEYGASTAYGGCESFTLTANYGCWKSGEQNWYAVYAFDGGYVNTAKFTVITENDESSTGNYKGKNQCEYSVNVKDFCEQEEGQPCETFKFMFKLNKKNIKFIKFEGTYYDSNNNLKNFSSKTLLVNKKGTDGASVDHTTVAGKAIQDPVNRHIDSGEERNNNSNQTTNTVNISGQKLNCTDLGDLISKYWSWVMILAPIACMFLIVLDFINPIMSSDAQAINKAASKTVKRTIALVLLLFLPTIINTIFGWFGVNTCF